MIGRPPVGASGSMKISCKKAQVKYWVFSVARFTVTWQDYRAPTPWGADCVWILCMYIASARHVVHIHITFTYIKLARK